MNDAQEPADRWRAQRASIGEGFDVARALPRRGRRSVGPWCFLDHFGPVELATTSGMRVGAHPHIGLQTVTWLFEGAVLHRDSLGSTQRVVPGELNLMTAGERGIAHSEHSPADAPSRLHGVQLWTALPTLSPPIEPGFEHHRDLPTREGEGAFVCVFVGELMELRSPATRWEGAVGAEIRLEAGAQCELELAVHDEHALFVVSGALASSEATTRATTRATTQARTQARTEASPDASEDTMLYHAPGRDRLRLQARDATRLILIGGAPRTEPLHMWWNFVAPDRQQIRAAVADWRAGHSRFGDLSGLDGAPIESPELPAAY